MSEEQTREEAPVAGIDRLPRTIEPRRDLWAGIESRLEPRAAREERARRGWNLGAVAASVAVAFLAGVLLGRQGPSPDPVTPERGATASLTLASAAAPSVGAAIEATEREYRAAWRGFEPVGIEPSLVAQDTADALERSWLEMTQAETALLAALDEHPDNPYLADKLLDLRGQQLDFMRALRRLEIHSRRET